MYKFLKNTSLYAHGNDAPMFREPFEDIIPLFICFMCWWI